MKYTVIIQRPEYATDDFGYDTFTAHVDEPSVEAAAHAGKVQAIDADSTSVGHYLINDDNALSNYCVLAIFKGHIEAEPYQYEAR